MKIKNKIIVPVIAGLVLALPFSSCVDEIKFGNSFLEKAPVVNRQRIQFSIVPNILVSS